MTKHFGAFGKAVRRSARLSPAGFTLTEVMITSALVGTMALGIAKVNLLLTQRQLASQADIELTADAARVISFLSVKLTKAGDGVPNKAAPLGQQVIARMPGDPVDRLLFFYKDRGAAGEMDAEDHWMRFRRSGAEILEETFKTDNWTNITAPGGGALLTGPARVLTLGPGVRAKRLEFYLYDSNQTTPVEQGHRASWVRIFVELEKGVPGSSRVYSVRKDAWVLLKNVIYARSY